LVEEIGVPGENHQPVISHWQTLSKVDITGIKHHKQTIKFSAHDAFLEYPSSILFYRHGAVLAVTNIGMVMKFKL
jgi:hypothetical protein